jgi:polyhydroxybutyrate depolymerase
MKRVLSVDGMGNVLQLPPTAASFLRPALLLLLCAVVVGCATDHDGGSEGSGGSDATAPSLEQDWILDGHPHLIDSYVTPGATRSVVFLHGGGGSKEELAVSLGLRTSVSDPEFGIDEAWLMENRITAVFPQGQAVDNAPRATTWSNYVMVSGADDSEFLQALRREIEQRYATKDVYLAGHSNGGMMANRLWCESTSSFEGYIAIAGPPSAEFGNGRRDCEPDNARPYLAIVGDNDSVLQTANGGYEDDYWEVDPTLVALSREAFVDPLLLSEVESLNARALNACSEFPEAGNAPDDALEGTVEQWNACDAFSLMRIMGGGHPIQSLETTSGLRILDLIARFIDAP